MTHHPKQSLRVLVIAAHYPPSSAAAAIRARNIVRNLQSLGHRVKVITARTPHEGEPPPEARAVPWLDLERLAKSALRGDTSVAQAPRPPRAWQRGLRTVAARLVVPDLHAPWIPMATALARRLVGPADVVLSTGGASAHVVARLIRGARPWIADINDIWWRNPHQVAGALRERIDWRFERGVIGSAAAVTVPNDALGAEIRRRFGRSPATIFTGFDVAEFDLPRNGRRTSTREIIFAGTLYADFRLSLLLEALAKGREGCGWSSSTLRVVFIGSGAGQAVAAAKAHGVHDFVEGVSPVPRGELLKRLVDADATVVPLYPSDHHLPMRFFDSVGSGRPMIGVGSPNADAAEMIQRHELGAVCSDVDTLTSVLDGIVRAPRAADLPLETRRLFDRASSRPALRQVLERLPPPTP